MKSELVASRVRGLLDAKGRLRQDELPGVSREELAQWLGGRDPGTKGLKRLASALEATSDYLIGIGDDYRRKGENDDNYRLAAARLSFLRFEREISVSFETRQACRKIFESDEILNQDGAPRTVEQWKTLSRMLERATPQQPPRIEPVRKS